jgi:predicted metal-dependent HD superfamily phosphohydrolase
MKYQVQLMLIEKFATRLLQRALPERLAYHNYRHTVEVVAAAAEIGRQSQLAEDEIELVQIAAWLHDLGHIRSYTDHETESQALALELLCMAGMPEIETLLIIGCIGATRMPQTPRNRLEAVLCDADLAHLAKPCFIERSELLREEWENILGRSYTDEAWMEQNLDFITRHRYHTSYGKTVLRQLKAQNVCRLMASVYATAA